MEMSESNNYFYFLKKLKIRKRIEPKQHKKRSSLNFTEYIEEEIEIMDECDWEVFEILNRKDDDDDKEKDIKKKRDRESRSCQPQLFFDTE